MGDHVYEPVVPAAGTDKTSSPARLQPTGPRPKDDGHSGRFLRIPLTEELVMADETGSESEAERPRSEEDDDDDAEENEDERAAESIYEGENENSSAGEPEDASAAAAGSTRVKAFQQKVRVKADVLRNKLQGVTKRKPRKQKQIAVDAAPGGEKSSRRKIGQFATLPKRFTFNAAKVHFSTAFGNFTRTSAPNADQTTAATAAADPEETKSGRFSLPRFGFSKTSSESPASRRSLKIGSSRLSVPGFRTRTWSDASKASRPDGGPKPSKLMNFGTYPRIFSKRNRVDAANNKSESSPPPPPTAEPVSRKDSFRRRFFRSHRGHKESTPGPSDDRTQRAAATLAVEEELDEAQVSKESLAEFGDSDLQEVISLSDDHRSVCKDTKSLSDHRPGVIEEIDSDEFFLRKKGLSRGDVHISNYLSSEIRHVFRSCRTRSVEGVNNNVNGGNNGIVNNNINNSNNYNSNDDDGGSGVATPVRPSRTNSLRRPARSENADRFGTVPKSFGGTKPSPPPPSMLENIVTSRNQFEPSAAALPSEFSVPWRKTTGEGNSATLRVPHAPPKPPARQRMTKFSTFDTRSMIDLSRKRSQSQFGLLTTTTTNFLETAPKAPLRRSRTSLAGSERDVSTAASRRPSWAVIGGGGSGGGGSGAPTPPLRRSRLSLVADADVAEERPKTAAGSQPPPPRPPPPRASPAGYATVDKTSSSPLLQPPPQSPARHRRKKSYEMIKSQEFGAFFTVPRRAYRTTREVDEPPSPPPCRPARAYNTLGPSRPRRRRLPVREHEYGDVSDDGVRCATSSGASSPRADDDDDDGPAACKAALSSGDVIEKMKFRPLPSPPPPPRCKSKPQLHQQQHASADPLGRRNTDSALVPFLDRRGASATLSDHDFFADVSRALLASAAANVVGRSADAEDDVSVAVQTDPLPEGYELDDLESCCSAESDGPTSRVGGDGGTSPTASAARHVDRPTTAAVHRQHNGYAMVADRAGLHATAGVICAQRISVNELKVGKMTVADVRGQRMGVDDVSGHGLTFAQLMQAAAGSTMPQPSLHAGLQQGSTTSPVHETVDRQQRRDDGACARPEADSDSACSASAAPTPPRRRSRPPGEGPPSRRLSAPRDADAAVAAIDLSAVAADPSVAELSCQLFRLCHTNVCSLFNKVAHRVVPEDTEKRRDLQAALCFLSIILAGLLILGFGNEKTIHHHHWDFQFPPANQ